MAKKKSFSSIIIALVRAVLTIAPIIWIYSRVDITLFLQAIADVAWYTVPLISASILTAMFIQGYRWGVLTRVFLPQLPLSRILSAHFKALFYSIILPTSAAQDIVRAAILTTKEHYSVLWGATWLCRLMGLLVLGLLSIIGYTLIGPSLLPAWLYKALIFSLATVCILTAFSFSKRITRSFRPVFSRLLPKKALQILDDIRQSI
jgi:uncharacterized membrane protein YbhN (UPF0104 family)